MGKSYSYPYLFKLGVRLPLHQFFFHFLTFYGLCLTQLTPNRWVVLLGIVVLSHHSEVTIDLWTLQSLLTPKHKFRSGSIYPQNTITMLFTTLTLPIKDGRIPFYSSGTLSDMCPRCSGPHVKPISLNSSFLCSHLWFTLYWPFSILQPLLH